MKKLSPFREFILNTPPEREGVLGFFLFVALAVVSIWVDIVPKNSYLAQNVVSIHGALASMAASLIGFFVASVSILISWSDKSQLERIRDTGSMRILFRSFFSAINVLAWMLGFSLFGLFMPLKFLLLGAFVTVAVGCVRLFRCVYALDALVDILFPDLEDKPEPPPESTT